MASMDWAKVAADAAAKGSKQESDEIETAEATIEQLAAKRIEEVVAREVHDAERAKRRVRAGIFDGQPVVVTPPSSDGGASELPPSVQEAIDRLPAEMREEQRAASARRLAEAQASAAAVMANATATATAPVVVPAGSSWYRKVTTKGNGGVAIVVGLLAAFVAWILWILVDDYAVGEGGWFSSPLVTLLIVLLVGIGAGLLVYNGESKVTETSSSSATPAASVTVPVTQQPAEAAASATDSAPQA